MEVSASKIRRPVRLSSSESHEPRLRKNAFLVSELIRRDLASRFAGSFGGPLWALANPLIFCLLYGFVFSVVLRASPPADFHGSYPEFLLAGLLPWMGIQEAVSRGSVSVTEHAHLVKKLRFPLEALVASALGAALLLEAAAVGLLLVFVAVSGHGEIHPAILATAFAMEALLLVGPVLVLASLHVFFRDLSQLLSPALSILFYLTPILYPDSLVPERYRRWLVWNPFRDVVALFRAGLYGTEPPPFRRLALWAVSFLVLAFAARAFFRRSRRSFVDLL
ncbi:MAG TPA: ABC transporter permease [Thermoanaerobaculia bacterium]|nr:ABC transporter permease [Thermoanaerobaculia bacterium]